MEAFHWYKTTLEFLKGNKVFLLIVTTALASGTAGHYVPQFMTVKPIEVTVVAQDNKCHECADLLKKYHSLNKQIQDVTKRYNKTVRDFHGG